MSVKVLVTATGVHIIADVKLVENKETGEVLGFELSHAQVSNYQVTEDKKIEVQFGSYCPISTGEAFHLPKDFIVSIHEPKEDALQTYMEIVNPAPQEVAITPEVV